jgi:thiol-disulfide isomerase/thioredoxin
MQKRLSMRKLFFAYLLFCAAITACKQTDQTSLISVSFILNKASAAYLNQKKVYLVTSRSKIVIDSITIKSEKNEFRIDPKKHDLSSTYSVFVLDNAYHPAIQKEVIIKRPLGYWNPFNHHYSFINFYIEARMNPIYMMISAIDPKEGKKKLPDEFKNNPIAQHSISPQNDILHKNIQIISEENHNPTGSAKHLKQNTAIIRKYSYSYALLDQMVQTKEHFTNNELATMSNLFDEKLRQTNSFQILTTFAKSRQFHDQLFPDSVPLLDQQGQITELGTKNSRYHLIVFWAWWCKPCREEIPALKQLYTQKKKQGLQIYHISIDGNQTKWQEALKYEQMPWDQLIVNQQSFNQLMAMYDLKAIPKSYLFDSSYQLIRSFTGFDTSSFQALTNSLK